MCCRRRNNNRRRVPLIIFLGKLAYDKYQSRQANRRALTANDALGRSLSPTDEKLSLGANAEVLQNAGINPPSYDDVVVVQGRSRDVKRSDDKWDDLKASELEANEWREDLSDDEEFFDVVADGRRVPSRELQSAQESFVGKWKGRRGMV